MLERILCAVFGHRYVVERVIAPHWRKVGCTRCGRSWGMHDPTKAFVPWDGEQEELAERLHPRGVAPSPAPQRGDWRTWDVSKATDAPDGVTVLGHQTKPPSDADGS